MHIPDGFLDIKTAVSTAVLSTVTLTVALRRLEHDLPRRKVPLMGLTAAFVFAAQMVNFPVAGGTSGHLMGSVLSAVLLGPAAGMVIMSAVLIVQCFLFADGGVLALGANVFNMAVIGVVAGYAVYRGVWSVFRSDTGRIVAVSVAAWCSTLLAALCCVGELAWSGTVAWSAAFPPMANIHMLIGLGEAVITTLVCGAIMGVRPDLLEGGHAGAGTGKDLIVYGLLITLGLFLFVSPFISPWPDGLASVAATLGFDRSALEMSPLHSPFENYTIPGVGSPVAATMIAGLVGTILMFLIGALLAHVAIPRHQGNKPVQGEKPDAT